MLKISSRGVSNLEKTKGQYFLSKESYFFTLRKSGCSDTPEPDWGPPGPGAGARALVLGLLSRCSHGLEAGGASGPWTSHPTPCTLAAHHQGVSISIETGLQEAVGHGPQPRCCRVGQLLMGVPGEVEGLDHISLVSFTFCVFSLLKGISWLLKHSVGAILVKMQYFYVM